jgi:multicomponent Na+:H+ antiporter subunit B
VTRGTRFALFGASIALVAGLLVGTVTELPSFGDYSGVYGIALNRQALPATHATSLVNAVNFDYRIFDTLGEEFILFAATIGVAIILREGRGERHRPPEEAEDEHRFGGGSSLLGVLGLAMVGPLVVLGVYIVSHGGLTPGGGFQGGIILAAPPLLAFLAGGYLAMKVVAPHALVELTEGAGAASLALIGFGGLIFAGTFFENFLPLGTARLLLSGGMIPLAATGVGLEVAGALLLLWTEFSDQALVIRGNERPTQD